MKNNLEKEKSKPAIEPVVIPDECGDSLWDSVLVQPAFNYAAKKENKKDAAWKRIKN